MLRTLRVGFSLALRSLLSFLVIKSYTSPTIRVSVGRSLTTK